MKGSTRSKHHERLRLARAFIDHHYDTPITLERVSQEAAFSPCHFLRLFRAVYRQTPHQYLRQRRIQRAKELLKSSDLSVTEVCFEVGFDSLGSFSTLFRNVVGLSPSEYRERARPISPTQAQSVFIPLCFRVKRGLVDLPQG